MLGFDAFADAVGFSRAEQVVTALGKSIVAAAREASDGGAFVGHMGGSDFIAVVAQERAETLATGAIAAFADLQTTHASILGDDGRLLAMVIAVAPTAGAASNDDIARRLGVAMKQAKHAGTAGYVTWSATASAAR